MSCSADMRCAGALVRYCAPAAVTIATACASEPAQMLAVGRMARSLSAMPSARASTPISRTRRTSSSAESASSRNFQVSARVVTESAMSPTQEQNLDHSSVRISAVAAARTPEPSSAAATARARMLSPPASSPTKIFTLRVNSTAPSGSSSPEVSASAPSTRSRPKASHQDLVLQRAVLDRQRHAEARVRAAPRATARCPGSWWRR